MGVSAPLILSSVLDFKPVLSAEFKPSCAAAAVTVGADSVDTLPLRVVLVYVALVAVRLPSNVPAAAFEVLVLLVAEASEELMAAFRISCWYCSLW